MKRIYVYFVSVLILIQFCGCAKKAEPVSMNRLYSVEACVEFNNFSADIGLNRLGNGVWDVNFVKPENLNGLSVSYENDKAKISYKGLSFSLDKEDIPVKAIVSSLANVLDNAALGKNITYTKNKGKIILDGEIDSMDYKIILDEKTGAILELELPKIKLKANFSGYKLMS